jgi:hypothetical protein
MLLISYIETVKFHFLPFGIMKIRNISDKYNTNRAVKAKAAMPIAGILAATALMAGLLFLISSETALAQEDMMATNATTAAGNATNATMAGAANATNATMAGAANATNATMAGAANATNATMAGAANATGEAANATNATMAGAANATEEAAAGAANATGEAAAGAANATGEAAAGAANATGEAGEGLGGLLEGIFGGGG